MPEADRDERLARGVVPGGWDQFFDIGVREVSRKHSAFTVYVADNFGVYWYFGKTQGGEDAAYAGGGGTGEPTERARTFVTQYARFLGRVAELEALPADFLSETNRRAFAVLIGESVALAMEASLQAAPANAATPVPGGLGTPERETLERAFSFYEERATETARGWLVQYGLMGAAVAGAVLLGHHLVPAPSRSFELSARQTEFLHAGMFGLMGAAFFLMWRVGSFPKVPAAGKGLHILECAARFATGFVAGILCELTILARVATTESSQQQQPGASDLAFLCLVSFAAGATERFLPSLVEKFQTTQSPALPSKRAPEQTPS